MKEEKEVKNETHTNRKAKIGAGTLRDVCESVFQSKGRNEKNIKRRKFP